MPEYSTLPWLPLAVGPVEIVGWDGFSYVDSAGLTYWSGAEPSAEDAVDAIQHPRLVPAPVPAEVPAWRVKAVAKLTGLDAAIEAAIAALAEPARTVASAAWFDGNVIVRDSATIATLSTQLGLSAAQVDDLFRQAAALEV